ncbi:DUF262 domain-containing protein [Candidatus Woesearchaeota archaeon]|nr:DUF262 domain-containing protein [Candidatus Woesearchaeota archaeon]
MKANAASILSIFETKLRLEVPLFQRQYVWNLENHWEPLWEDISRKFVEYINGKKDAPLHFLGAIVLDQKQTPTTYVETRQVIDGQQRLTTLQIILAALRDFCLEQGSKDLAEECESFTFNKGMMANPKVDRFKVWPTQLDRPQFTDVMGLGSRIELEKKYPLHRRKYAKKYDPRPKMIEAYLYFYDSLSDFFLGTESESPIGSQYGIANRLNECFQALKNALRVVIIDLDVGDDAQVIFETLNARGEPLLPADLLRNFIFLRVVREGKSAEELYEKYWQRFDDHFWREVVRQGRLQRPRSDLFMQHFLSSIQAEDIPIKHLYVEYKWWIERKMPFKSIEEELAMLARQGDNFRKLIAPKKSDMLYSFINFLNSFDIGTVYPLLLYLFEEKISEANFKEISRMIESYLLRRAVCGYTTKAYNRIFLMLIKYLQENEATVDNIRKYLSELKGESVKWPDDSTFSIAWENRDSYENLNYGKITYILKRVNDTFLTNKNEMISIDGPLSVEHILPQTWVTNWPLPDGSKGMTHAELFEAPPDDARSIATKKRNSLLHTMGNLTILTQPLNSGLSNNSWESKKSALLRASLLPINQELLHNVTTWDEKAIHDRSRILFKKAVSIWLGPSTTNH